MLTALFGTDEPSLPQPKPAPPAPRRRSSTISLRRQAWTPPPPPIDPDTMPLDRLRDLIGYVRPDFE